MLTNDENMTIEDSIDQHRQERQKLFFGEPLKIWKLHDKCLWVRSKYHVDYSRWQDVETQQPPTNKMIYLVYLTRIHIAYKDYDLGFMVLTTNGFKPCIVKSSCWWRLIDECTDIYCVPVVPDEFEGGVNA